MSGSVSIVIPCYNYGLFLPETIASIERVRTPSLREVIIVDDGSTDPSTIEVLKNYEQSGYQVLWQKNQGVGAARNNGIRLSTGEFILPVDSDNRLCRTYLDKAVTLLQADPKIGVIYGDAEYFGEREGRWNVPEFDLLPLIQQNYIDACALIRRAVWEEVGGYDEKMPYLGWEDWDFWLRSALRGWGFMHLPEIAFEYRVRQGSMLAKVDRHDAEMFDYMFAKKDLRAIGQIRDEIRRLRNVDVSWELRLGKCLVWPIRRAGGVFRSSIRPIATTR